MVEQLNQITEHILLSSMDFIFHLKFIHLKLLWSEHLIVLHHSMLTICYQFNHIQINKIPPLELYHFIFNI